MELWAEIEEWPGFWVSTDGRVCGPQGLRKLRTNKHGYPVTPLRRGGRSILPTVHRLVLTTFTGSCPGGYEGAHWNGVRTDNRLVNLRWATRKDNLADRVRHGTLPVGEKHVQWKSHCKRGHRLTPENAKVREGGGRNCLVCSRERARRRHHEKREAELARMRQGYRENREQRAAVNRAWVERNKDRVREYKREWARRRREAA